MTNGTVSAGDIVYKPLRSCAPDVDRSASRHTEDAAPSVIPELDGLRAIAILGVLAFHLQIHALPGVSLGWSGVELFFVISGFLISRILLNSRDRPHYFRNFYIRRTLRIFPIYYFVIVLYSTAALLSGSHRTLRVMPFYYVYLQTIPQLISHFTCAPMLDHTWSLAIEEQFYFVWPLAVFLLRGRKFLFTMIFIVVGALGVRYACLPFHNPFLIDGWLPAQVDALAAGAIVAWAAQNLSRRRMRLASSTAFILGSGGLTLAVWRAGIEAFWSPQTWATLSYGPLVLSALACAFAGAVGLASTCHPATQWLKFSPLLHIGRISYGIYLYHPFAFLCVRMALSKYLGHPAAHYWLTLSIVGKLSATYLAARLSWEFIEKPINGLKDRFSRTTKPQAEPVLRPLTQLSG